MNCIIPGNYCPRGTKSKREHQCPPGTFSDKVGLIKASQCDPCSPGKFCAGYGNVKPSGDCAAGMTLCLWCNSCFLVLFPENYHFPHKITLVKQNMYLNLSRIIFVSGKQFFPRNNIFKGHSMPPLVKDFLVNLKWTLFGVTKFSWLIWSKN